MHTNFIKTAVALGLAGLSFGTFASTYGGECTNRPKAEWMATAKVKTHFESQGYTVGKVKVGGSCYEIYARDKAGNRVELFVNPVDAKVVAQAGKP